MADTDFNDVHDGDPAAPWMLNVIYRELRRWRKLRAAWPLKVTSADGLMPPTISLGPMPIGAVGKLTSSLTARSGATYGTGTFTLQIDTGTQYSDDPNMTGQPCQNLLNKTGASGNYVGLLWTGNAWLVVAIGDCGGLS